MNNSKKIPRIAIIGLGNQGRKHLNSIIALDKKKAVKLVGICDVSRFSDIDNNIPFYSDYRNLCMHAKPDIIVITTPNYLHKQMAIAALESGANVIKEKPLAINYLDAKELLTASVNTGKQIITLQQRFYSPLFLKAQEIIPSLGKIISFSYRFTLNDTTKSWYWDLDKAGGGSWLNMGWHAISIIQWLIGDIKEISLDWKINNKRPWDYKTDHLSFARVIVNNNIIGSLFLSCAYPQKEESLKITLSKGILFLSRNGLKIFSLKKNKTIQNYQFNQSEEELYELQLTSVLKKIKNNSYDDLSDLKKMGVIQAGIDSVNAGSSMIQVEKKYKPKLNYFKNKYYAKV